MSQDSYKTIAGAAEAALKIKGSRFLGFAAPISGRQEAEAFLDELRRRYFDATHHCYAWRLGDSAGENSRFSDDGEPPGTAGKPLLQAITGRDLTNLIVVVVRYFGGTKLGVGGLVHAYSDCAARVLDACTVQTIWRTRSCRFTVGYDHLSAVMRLIEQHGAIIEEVVYGGEVTMRLALRLQEAEAFRTAAVEATRGTIHWER
ncbi:MAG TPA: YigZ family protein [bacterium]|nr:YigZ family protein [bacterium]HQG46673.1 YigZ family protein [bacterium]HQI47509.1 YigZ family protein [bacterium]HQJ65775.1 YigZ family protein [bacterium]